MSESPFAVRLVRALEDAPSVEPLTSLVAPLSRAVLRLPGSAVLRGGPAGHALHPALTDLPIGAWTSASLLDLVGGRGARTAARSLVAAGLLSAVPTALTGLAEWGHTDARAGRVGAVHAAGNTAALALQAASWLARRRGSHRTGAALSLVGAAVAGASAYLGGHLVTARNVASRDRAFAPSLPADAAPALRSEMLT